MEKKDLSEAFFKVIKSCVEPDALTWLVEQAGKIRSGMAGSELSRIFAQIPRYTSKIIIGHLDKDQLGPPEDFRTYSGWTLESFCRVWMLLQLPANDKASYIKAVDALFNAAEMNELVALYQALPFLKYPEAWVVRCEEGIRSNIGLVLEAIMYNNSFPAAWLSEQAWNQMVLKAFFTDKDVYRIDKLEVRMNTALIIALEDYAKERLAAGRNVNPDIYKLINKKA